MNKALLVLTTSVLLAYLPSTYAVEIESTTTQYLSFRECVAGESPCDSIRPTKASVLNGLPGSQESQASQHEPGFGTASGTTRISNQGFGSEHHAQAASLEGTRVGSNGFMVQKYTNDSDGDQILTLRGTLVFKQTVPEANAGVPEGSPGRTVANAEMAAFRMNVEVMEAGTTASDNFSLLMEGPKGDVESTDLAFKGSEAPNNRTAEGSEEFSITVTAAPGESTWLFAGLQSLAANGAKVTAHFSTELVVTGVD